MVSDGKVFVSIGGFNIARFSAKKIEVKVYA